jgi:WXXGXW repeat (2 copies)
MRTPFYLLALFGLLGCAAEPPVTTTTTTTTTQETVTTGPARRVGREVLVTQAPPPVRVETRTVAPGPNYAWTNGYWRWNGVRYEWVPGGWIVRPRVAAVWVEGHWDRRPGGWIWIPGHWQ